MKTTILVLAFLLNACQPQNRTDIGAGVSIYTDTETGCQYVKAAYIDGGLYPRMNIDGKQICKKAEAK